MFLMSRMLFIYTETPLHAGSGSGLGAVDLPIQRERTTAFPLVQASGIKGALRGDATAGDVATAIFGADDASHAGALSAGDARILLFPVRSLRGVFGWTTSIGALARFRRDAVAAGVDAAQAPKHRLPALPALGANDADTALVSGAGLLVDPAGQVGARRGTAVLEEFSFSAREDRLATEWAGWLSAHALPADDVYAHWSERLKHSLIVLPEEAFRDFLLSATEVVTRVRLTPESKTVAPGALWTQEHLPSDSLLYAPIHATKLRVKDHPPPLADPNPREQARKVLAWVANGQNIRQRIQLGGDETVGRGMVALRWSGGAL